MSLSLYEYQKYGAAWLQERRRAILADQMGVGKTLQAICALPKDAAAIVVCPPGLLRNWKYEINRAIQSELTSPREIYEIGSGEWKWPRVGNGGPYSRELALVSYTRLPKPIGSKSKEIYTGKNDGEGFPIFAYREPAKGTILIADEAHYVKNSKSNRTQAFRTLANVIHKNDGNVWLLSGTPMLNRPDELWSMLQALDYSAKSCFGSWEQFCRDFNRHESVVMYGRKVFPKITWGLPVPGVYDKIKPYFLRRTREQVLPDLPNKTITKFLVSGKPNVSGLDEEELTNLDQDEFLKKCVSSPVWQVARKQLAAFKINSLLDLISEF